MIKKLLAAFAALGLSSLSLSTFANGVGTVTVTQTFHNAVQSIPSNVGGANPCTGAPGTITIVYNGVVHATYQPSVGGLSNQWDHFQLVGDYAFVPDDTGTPSYAGHFVLMDNSGVNDHSFVTTATSTIHLVGSDGSSLNIRAVAHLTIVNPSSANPEIVVDHFRFSC